MHLWQKKISLSEGTFICDRYKVTAVDNLKIIWLYKVYIISNRYIISDTNEITTPTLKQSCISVYVYNSLVIST